TKSWNERVAEEEDMVQHQAVLLDRAVAGTLSEDAFNSELGGYWLDGSLGRGHRLGSGMFSAPHATGSKKGGSSRYSGPPPLFRSDNQAIEEKPELLKGCVRMAESAVKQSLAIELHP